jgi:hypothetical protein
MKIFRSSRYSPLLLLSYLAIAQIPTAHRGWADAGVTDCDALAASPTDKSKVTTGVAFSELNSSLAILACEDALRAFPSSDRLKFQLARALNKADRFSEAISLYIELAGRNHVLAMYNLSVLYMAGTGPQQDEAKALDLLQKSAEAGYGLAQYQLGLFYATGRHVEKDLGKATYWYERGSSEGDPSAQNELGWIYKNGVGVQADLDRALDLFQKSAAGGNAFAQYNLGLLYLDGKGVSKDQVEAAKWFKLSADQGYAFCCECLGNNVSRG